METRDPPRERRFLIPLSLVIKVKNKGVSLERLQEMVRLSTRCTHPNGNRRYEDFIFTVKGNQVLSVLVEGDLVEVDDLSQYYDCVSCRDTGKVGVFNPCDYCDGTGCERCDMGLNRASIPCPTCALNKLLSRKR